MNHGDKILQPQRLEIDPNSNNSEKLFKHWRETFTNYVDDAYESITDPAVLEKKKRRALINSVSADVFELISDASSFTIAMEALSNA